MLDRRLVEQVAAELPADAGLVEKDWHVVRAISTIASANLGDAQIAFSGGTSLSMGWQLIRRFSEDIDFKVAMPAATSASKARTERSAYRQHLLDALVAGGFAIQDDPLVGNAGQFLRANLAYPTVFPTVEGLRPHIQIEVSFYASKLKPIARPIRSLIATVTAKPAEVAGFLCIDPVETAADKLSALAWRVCARDRKAPDDDPTIIRHLYDLAALEQRVSSDAKFRELVREIGKADTKRGSADVVPADLSERFDRMLSLLTTDAQWKAEYAAFIRVVSFPGAEEIISFEAALAAAKRLVRVAE